MRMTAFEIYNCLSGCDWWKNQNRKMRWIAARYYANVEKADDLWSRTTHRPNQGVEISREDVAEIIRLR